MDPPDLRDFVSRLRSQDRGLQTQIAKNVARIYIQTLDEPVPPDLSRFLAGLGVFGPPYSGISAHEGDIP